MSLPELMEALKRPRIGRRDVVASDKRLAVARSDVSGALNLGVGMDCEAESYKAPRRNHSPDRRVVWA